MKLLCVLVKLLGWIKAYIRWIIILMKEEGGLTTSKKMRIGNKGLLPKGKQRNLKAKLEDNLQFRLSMINELTIR